MNWRPEDLDAYTVEGNPYKNYPEPGRWRMDIMYGSMYVMRSWKVNGTGQ